MADKVDQQVVDISIHAPRGGSDLPAHRCNPADFHFNPRSPWGERRYFCATVLRRNRISIHAPRGGSDQNSLGQAVALTISIHAPRGGSDSKDAQIFL